MYNSYHCLLDRESLPALDLALFDPSNPGKGDGGPPEWRSRGVKTKLSRLWRREEIKGTWSPERTGFQDPRVCAIAELQVRGLPDCFPSLCRKKGAAAREDCLGPGARSPLAEASSKGGSELREERWAPLRPPALPVSLFDPKEGQGGD